MNGKISHVYRLENNDEYFAMMERDKRCTETVEPVRAAHLLVRYTERPDHEGRHVIWIHLKDGTALRFYINQEGRLTGNQQFPGVSDTRFDLDIEQISQNSVKKYFCEAMDEIRRKSERVDFISDGLTFWEVGTQNWTAVSWNGAKAVITSRHIGTRYFSVSKEVFDITVTNTIKKMTEENLKRIPDQNDRNARDDCDG